MQDRRSPVRPTEEQTQRMVRGKDNNGSWDKRLRDRSGRTCRVSQPPPARARERKNETGTVIVSRAPSPCQCSARAAQDIWEHHRPAVGSSMRALVAAYTAPQRSESQTGLSGPGEAQQRGEREEQGGRTSGCDTTALPVPPPPLRTHNRKTKPKGNPTDGRCEPEARWEGDVSLVIGINQTNHSTNQERPCTTVRRIKKELSVCPS